MIAYVKWRVLGLWPNKLDFQKYFKHWHPSNFISKYTWSLIQVRKVLNGNDINISQHSLNSWPVGGNTADPRRECKQYLD